MRESPNTRQVVSLFSGAGGLDIGLEMAGLNVSVALDNDPQCIKTLKLNQAKAIPNPRDPTRQLLASTRIVEAAIEDVSAADLLGQLSSDSQRPLVVVGGPPCQPFSSAGRMQSLRDPRGRLFEEFVRLAGEINPRFILFENVRGLVTARGPRGAPGEALNLVRQAFEGIGYGTSFQLVNAADFGVPQTRVRCIMLASRSDPLPVFPEPSHEKAPTPRLEGTNRRPWVSLGEFLSTQREPHNDEITRPSAKLAPQLRALAEGTGLKSPRARETTRPGGHWGYKQGTFVAALNRPARTVTAASTADWVRGRDGSLRRLTWRECAGLQGFPEDWDFVGSVAAKYRQIGNAVPALLAEAMGSFLARAACQPERGSAASMPFPDTFVKAISYTDREQSRNGESRRLVREANARGSSRQSEFFGLGGDNPATGRHHQRNGRQPRLTAVARKSANG